MTTKMTKKEKSIFLVIIIASILIIFFPYIFLGKKYLNSFDTLNLHIPFYTEFRNKIYNCESLFWSHNFLFGSSFLTGKAFYLTTDIFSYIFLLFPFLEVVDALFVLQLIKNIVSYVGMYKFLDEFNFSFKSKIVGAIAYTFSGWFLLFYGMPTFSSFAALIPYFFLFLEKYIKSNKWLGLVILTTILILSNFYLFYSLSIFLVFYWIARYLLYYNEKFNIKKFIKKTALLILIYLLGVGVSAPIMIPTINGMLHNSRIGNTGAMSILWSPKKVYVDMFVKFISSPVYVSKNMNTVLQSNYYRLDQIGLFTTSCFCLLFPQIFYITKKRTKIIIGVFIGIMLLFLFTQIGCSVFHGFSEPSFRWTLFITFVICIIFVYLINHLEQINFKLLLFSLFFYSVIILLLILCFDMYNSAKIQLLTLSISLVFMIIYAILVYKNNKCLWLLIIIEIIMLGFVSNDLWGDKYQNHYNYDFVPSDYFKKFNNPEEFYRIWISDLDVDMDYQKDFNYNSNLLLGYKGYYSYDSEYQTSMSDLLKSYGQYYQWYGFNKNGLLNATSAKYYVAKYREEIPNDNIELIERIGNSNYCLYRNKNYKNFGYTNNNVYSFEKWINENIDTKDQYINDYLVVSEEDIKTYNLDKLSVCDSHYLHNLKYTNCSFDGDITASSDELLFLSIPYDEGWRIYCDNKELKKIMTDSGFMSVLLSKGMHHIKMKYIPYGFNIGVLISVVSVVCLLFIRKKN